MRIALAAPLYAPDFGGGVVRVVRRLAHGAVAAGHEVAVLAGRAVADVAEGEVVKGEVDGVPVWRVNVGGALAPFAPNGYRSPGGTAGARAFLAAQAPDVLHVHGLQGLGVGLLEEAAAREIPIVATLHDWWWSCPCLFRLSPQDGFCPLPDPGQPCPQAAAAPGAMAAALDSRAEVLDAARELIDLALVPGTHLRDDLVAAGWPAERLLLAPNGTAVRRESVGGVDPAASQAPEADRKPLRVGFFGGAGNREKGLYDLVAAAEMVPPDACRFFAWDVAAEEAGVLSGESWQVFPAFAHADLERVLSGLDVLAVPSRMRESFSLVTREAMANGVPVLATECGGTQEVIVDGVNGCLVPAGDPAALAGVLSRLASDRAEVARLGAAAARTAAGFETVAGQVEQAIDCWRRVVSERVGRRFPRRSTALEGMRVLFLAGIDDGPLRYRVHNVAEALAALGIRSRTLFHADPRAAEEIRHADLLVLFRTPWSVAVRAAVGEARRRGLRVVYSVDDLLFPATAAASAPALAHSDAKLVAGFAAANATAERAARLCDAILVSTPTLGAALESLGLPVFVLRNQLGTPQIAAAARALPAASAPGERGGDADGRASRRIGYFSGTDTHDADLARIAGPLAAVLRANPQWGLVLGGPLAVPAALASLGSQVETRSLVGWSDLPVLLAELDVNLSPLVTGNAFNDAKSDVKFLEAALVAVPTLGSPSPELFEGSLAGRVARLADTDAAWEESLMALLADGGEGPALGAAARGVALRERVVGAHAVQWADALLEILGRPPLQAVAAGLPDADVFPGSAAADVALSPAAQVCGPAQLRADHGEALRNDGVVLQEFAGRAGLRRLDLRFGTFGRENSHEVAVDVRKKGGKSIGRRKIRTELLVDRAWVGVDLDEGADTAGTLRIEIRAQGAAAKNAVLPWRGTPDTGSPGADRAAGPLVVDGREIPGETLSFRTFGDPDI